jgi:hypothetical protein
MIFFIKEEKKEKNKNSSPQLLPTKQKSLPQ